MKRIILFIVTAITFSSCYTVSQVGNCKYYTYKNLSSKGRAHAPIGW